MRLLIIACQQLTGEEAAYNSVYVKRYKANARGRWETGSHWRRCSLSLCCDSTSKTKLTSSIAVFVRLASDWPPQPPSTYQTTPQVHRHPIWGYRNPPLLMLSTNRDVPPCPIGAFQTSRPNSNTFFLDRVVDIVRVEITGSYV